MVSRVRVSVGCHVTMRHHSQQILKHWPSVSTDLAARQEEAPSPMESSMGSSSYEIFNSG